MLQRQLYTLQTRSDELGSGNGGDGRKRRAGRRGRVLQRGGHFTARIKVWEAERGWFYSENHSTSCRGRRVRWFNKAGALSNRAGAEKRRTIALVPRQVPGTRVSQPGRFYNLPRS
ncbi:hypothetical protein K466DRAFT_383736 [Polyporus arcularius HHB13444]|uniref:Uncharacterized protein n=1 Tax=Polyporus arcularius HHB13444 TaxID=1314778 RepID=A0A5C3NVJ6_9APHY|nr:hypothetical protein K466DRAFT_383736 [Polyporus arcularius HHB13444]